MNSTPTIELKAVSKRYDKLTVVDGIDLQINKGESFVLVGHNGAGKTTIMKLMLGLTQASSGQVLVMGENPANKSFSARRGMLGYLPESVSFYHHMTGLELLNYYASLKGVAKTEVSSCLEQVNLSASAGKRVNTYSKGMRQRLGLAQAILGKPELLFLDEPTTGLDPSLRRDFYQIISDLRAAGATVVISSHSLSEIETQADRIALIRSGKLVACGSLDALSEQAGLPVHTRLAVATGHTGRVAAQLEPHFEIQKITDHSVDLVCPVNKKISLLRQVADLGEVVLDINMNAPRLNEIYLHFMNGEKA
ncbi:MAG: ABC transporter ATP-binding protein [Xanthomonadales bacterium]|nr:ABC transporter ATP-binding protein [Xanthomonadales bacterium]